MSDIGGFQTNTAVTVENQAIVSTRYLAPVARQERIRSLDFLRGYAVLAIFVINVGGFSSPGFSILIPSAASMNAATNPHAAANLISWVIRWLLFVGKGRGLFSALFGAGVILLTERAEKRGARDEMADIFQRRHLWLGLFGLIHGIVLWFGDILLSYSLVALLFLFPLRKLRPKILFAVATLLLAADSFLNPYFGLLPLQDLYLKHQITAAQSAWVRGAAKTTEYKAEVLRLQLHQEAWAGTSGSFQKQLNKRHGFWQTEIENAQESLEDDRDIPLLVLDRLGMMILGMALYKIGFLSGRLSTKLYLTLVLVAFLMSMPMLGIGLWRTWASGMDMITFEMWLFIPNSYYRVMGTLGMSSLLLVIFKSNRLCWLTRSLEAVGQAALSNYLLCSLLADIVFSWGPWKLYGRLEQYQLNYVIAAFWVVTVVWSNIWLKYFAFGPIEWLWRSLTYWRRQPFCRVEYN